MTIVVLEVKRLTRDISDTFEAVIPVAIVSFK